MITHDPFVISVGRRRLLADPGAEKVTHWQGQDEKVVIEIKVLGGESLVNDLHRAIGQYQNYRSLLRYMKSERKLYLAIPRNVYEEEFGTFGGQPFGAMIGDYEFSNHPQDMALLEKISGVAAAANANL